MTPMTIPAIAPALRPLLAATCIPVTALPSVATGAWKATVVVAAVEITVATVLLVGRIKADAAEVVAGV